MVIFFPPKMLDEHAELTLCFFVDTGWKRPQRAENIDAFTQRYCGKSTGLTRMHS